MLRGEFRFKNGLVIPNNVTKFGASLILDMAMRDAAETFYVGLCQGVFDPDLQIEDLTEPTLGVNNYGRLAIARDGTDWPTLSDLNGEQFVESKELVWEAIGGDFDQAITRMFLTTTLAGTTGDVFALSGALPGELLIAVDTDEADRTFTYRLYLR